MCTGTLVHYEQTVRERVARVALLTGAVLTLSHGSDSAFVGGARPLCSHFGSTCGTTGSYPNGLP